MMIKANSKRARQATQLLCSAAIASALCFALPAAAQTSGASAASPTSPPASPPAKAQKPARKPLAERLKAICSSADLDHDGSVSLDEFHQDIVQSWHNLSPDATGHVPLADLAQVPRMGQGRLKRLAAIDKDGDGKLSFKEVVETRMAYFDAADANQDDQLSIQECVAHERLRRSSKPQVK
jgi:hypothetical protein